VVATDRVPGRLHELDSLRGIAAATVLLNHLSNTFGDNVLLQTWGHSAVLLFFLLSGFVLYLSFDSAPNYGRFIVRRVFRLYPAYLAAVLVSFALANALSGWPMPSLSEWFREFWAHPFGLGTLLRQASMVGVFDINALDPPVWSLVHEMRISLVFPLLVLFVRRYPLWLSLVTAFAVGLGGFVIGHGYQVSASWLVTPTYLMPFAIGTLLARHRAALASWLTRQSRLMKWALLGWGLAAYSAAASGYLQVLWVFGDWAVVAGASLFIMLAISSPQASAVLSLRPVRFLGRISYSFYLWHMVVLLTVFRLLSGIVPIWALVMLTFAAAIGISTASYYLLEEPFMRLGRRLARPRAAERAATAMS